MAKQTVETYAHRYQAGVKYIMADRRLETLKEAAEYLKINYMSLYKIMDGSANPTVLQCIILCNKGGFSANWLLLDLGEIKYSSEVESANMMAEIRSIKHILNTRRS